MKSGINCPLVIPPCKGIRYVFGIGAEIAVKVVTKIRFGGAASAGKSSKMLSDDDED